MTTCPSEEVLRAYLAENLGKSEAERIDTHLEDCCSCQAALSRLSDESALGVDLGSHPMIYLGPSDDAGLLQIKERLKESGAGNGSTRNQALSFLDPPRVDGDLGSLGPYRVRSVMGRGGTAIVFKAADTSQRDVALKVLRPELDDRQNRARFLRGGRSGLSIRNPHVVEVVSVEDPPRGLPYLAMEYVDGETLHDRVERRKDERLTARAAAEIALQIAEGLSAAHQQGLVHRDVKSANILLDRVSGRAKIADFGLARNIQLPPEITRQGEVSGTPEFMSREQILTPDLVDARCDVYGLGVVLYHALTGELPFRGTLLGVLRQVLDDEPVAPCRRDHAIPRELETICLKCLEKDPRHRYTSAAALAEDLQRHLDGEPIRAKRPGMVRRTVRQVRRHPAWAAALLVGAVTISSSGVIVGSIKAAHARAEAISADVLRIAAEGRAEAEQAVAVSAKREAQTLQRETEALKREASIQQMQRIRLTYQRSGWSEDAWGMARTLSLAGRDARIQSEAAACLAGLDLRKVKSMAVPGLALAFDPSGTRLMIGGVSLFRPETERPIQTWDSTTDQVQAAGIQGGEALAFAFRPDGSPLLLKVPDREPLTTQLWDVDRGQLLRTFKLALEGKSKIQALALTPNGSWVAVSARKLDAKGEPADVGSVAVWEAATGREILRSATSSATHVALAPDASLLALGFEDGHVSLWSLPQGKPLDPLRFDRNPIACLSFGRDPVRRPGRTLPSSGWLLASGDRGGGLIVWDVASHTPRSICHGPAGSPEVISLTFSPDGTTLASAGGGKAQLWDLATGQLLLNVEASNYTAALAFSPDGRRLAVGCVAAFGAADKVDVWELEPGRGIDSLRGLSQSVFRAVFPPDGHLVGALSNDWRVGIWDRASRRLLHVLEVTRGEFPDNAALAFSPDGKQFAFSAGHEASLWDVVTGELVKTWKLSEGLCDHMAFPEAKRLLLFRVETESGELGPFGHVDPIKHPRVCRVRDLLGADPIKPVAEIRDCNLSVFESECSPDGKYYVIEGRGGSPGHVTRVANLYEGPTGKKIGALPTQLPVDWVGASFNFDSTGSVLNYFYESTAKGSRAYFLEMPSLAVLRRFDQAPYCLGPRAKRWLLASPVTADQPGTLSLFDQELQDPLIRFLPDLGGASWTGRPRFSPDGLHLVWGNPSGAVTVVDLVEVNRRLTAIGQGW